MKTIKFAILITVLTLAACTKSPIEEPPKEDNKACKLKGKFQSVPCGWGIYGDYWIKLEDGTFLQPCQSDIAKIEYDELYDGKEVEVGYTVLRSNCYSNVSCLVILPKHTNVKLTCLKEIENPKCEYKHKGVLQNWHGKLAGCGWIIKLTNGDFLEVSDADLEGKNLKDGMSVEFDYSVQAKASVCMVGVSISIKCIRAVNTIQ